MKIVTSDNELSNFRVDILVNFATTSVPLPR